MEERRTGSSEFKFSRQVQILAYQAVAVACFLGETQGGTASKPRPATARARRWRQHARAAVRFSVTHDWPWPLARPARRHRREGVRARSE